MDERQARPIKVKLVVVGDENVGKTCLQIVHEEHSFPVYVPTVNSQYAEDVTCDGRPVRYIFFDTCGQEDYDRLRPLCYPETDLFLVCFSIGDRRSLENVQEKWLPELDHFCPCVPRVLVGCKSDLRTPENEEQCIPHKEIRDFASRLGLTYVETSALAQKGVKECFDTALRVALNESAKRRMKKKSLHLFGRKKAKEPKLPEMPPAERAPEIEIETSTFAIHWKKALEESQHADVVFVAEGRHRFRAHKVVLCSASQFFRRVLSQDLTSQSQLATCFEDINFTFDDLSSGRVSGIATIREEQTDEVSTKTVTVIDLCCDIRTKIFAIFLQFLYTGDVSNMDELDDNDRSDLINISKLFQCKFLETICVNACNDEEFLNPSIGTYLNDEMGSCMKEYFLNSSNSADIIFKVEGHKVYAHKSIVCARCEVMAAMFSGHFVEATSCISEAAIHETSVDTFLALLEYLYSDHAPVEDVDSVGLLQLANRYCLRRLVNLCELYITKQVERSISKNIEKADVGVIELLIMSQLHGAKQQERWCLHFISTNYLAFEKRADFGKLTGANLDYVEMNRWPPVSYLNQVEEYERRKRCSIM